MKQRKLFQGFTLIELLIVIAIIGILAVALLPSVLGAPARARDAARKADMATIIKAIEVYNGDNGNYPAGKLCLKKGADPDLDKYFQGGNPPKDPSDKIIGGCLAGEYLYCQLDGDPSSYYVATAMEIDADGNADVDDIAVPACADVNQNAPAWKNPPDAGDALYAVEK